MKTYIIDSFTNEAFKGNPAGVCLVEKALDAQRMLKIAQELGFSETAFVQKMGKENCYSIRYFSPIMEIPLCGHATLAASKVLFENERTEELNFFTIENIDLHIQREDDLIVMEFPIYKTVSSTAPKGLLDALGIIEILNVEYNAETEILLLELADYQLLAKLKPDFVALKKSHDSINGVVVTAASGDDGFDFHSRYFWPWSGGEEDPVTGGTHTFLTPYWAERLGKKRMRSFQSSERSGFMEVEMISSEKLLIRGEAILVLEGDLLV